MVGGHGHNKDCTSSRTFTILLVMSGSEFSKNRLLFFMGMAQWLSFVVFLGWFCIPSGATHKYCGTTFFSNFKLTSRSTHWKRVYCFWTRNTGQSVHDGPNRFVSVSGLNSFWSNSDRNVVNYACKMLSLFPNTILLSFWKLEGIWCTRFVECFSALTGFHAGLPTFILLPFSAKQFVEICCGCSSTYSRCS